jgi:dipeptidase E
MKKIFLFLIILLLVFLFLFFAQEALAHLPRLIYNSRQDIIEIINPEVSQAFYDQLNGKPREYAVNSENGFTLYANLLVPEFSNYNGRYSAKIFEIKNGEESEIAFLDGQTGFVWQELYEPYGRDYYLKGPGFEKNLAAGNYKIRVFNYENKGKYVLVAGKQESFPISEIIKVYWALPMLKIQFFQTSVFEFLLTPFGLALIGIIALILLIIAFFTFLSSIIEKVKKNKRKMLLLTSSGMQGSKEEIMAILQKPVEDTRIAHIITASKNELDTSYVQREKTALVEAGFNVADVDIGGKNSNQLLRILGDADIVYVQGGNTFYLLKQMQRCNFKKVMKKLFKKGVIYIGVSAGSIVAGKNIETAGWYGDQNLAGLKDLRGLNFAPFSIFPHYKPEHAEIIKKQPQKIKNKLKIITDEQAIFIFDSQISLVGRGEAINPNNL